MERSAAPVPSVSTCPAATVAFESVTVAAPGLNVALAGIVTVPPVPKSSAAFVELIVPEKLFTPAVVFTAPPTNAVAPPPVPTVRFPVLLNVVVPATLLLLPRSETWYAPVPAYTVIPVVTVKLF